MAAYKKGIFAVFAVLALAGCSSGARVGDGPQSFLGISQDIRSIFGTQDDYRSPLRPSYLAN